MIINSNKGVGNGANASSIPLLLRSILDRFLHHCHVINIKDDSLPAEEAFGDEGDKGRPD